MTPSPRRRGAQPGNRNNLRHGFYARHLRRSESSDLASSDFKGLSDEISLIRVFIRRMVALVEATDDPFEFLYIVRTLCMASDTLTRLIRSHQALNAGNSGPLDVLNQALEQVVSEWKIAQSSPPSNTPSSPNSPLPPHAPPPLDPPI